MEEEKNAFIISFTMCKDKLEFMAVFIFFLRNAFSYSQPHCAFIPYLRHHRFQTSESQLRHTYLENSEEFSKCFLC